MQKAGRSSVKGQVALILTFLILLSAATQPAEAGLFGITAYGICQTGCNGVAVACYAAAGFTFGTVTGGVGVPASIIGCNVALGACMASCALVALSPC
jgi:hypothetical protein